MAKSKTNSSLIALIAGILLVFIGGSALAVSLMLNDGNADSKTLYDAIMYSGIGLAALGVIIIVVAIVTGKSGASKKKSGASKNPSEEHIADVEMHLDGSATYSGAPSYVPETETFEFVTVGRRQSVDDKFDQIGKMGKTQFVIYIAKLFSLKGFEVQLTPVIENHGIDMIVKRDGVSRAVGCLLSNKVLCQADLVPVRDGESFYGVHGCMIITNMYFDRTSLDYAKENKITLVDRNILAEQYMN